MSIVNLNSAVSKVVLTCCSLYVVRYKVILHDEGTSNQTEAAKIFGHYRNTLHIQTASNAVGTVTIPAFINKLLQCGLLFLFVFFFVIFVLMIEGKNPPKKPKNTLWLFSP